MITRTFLVFGKDGHQQREAFNASHKHDFSEGKNTRIIEVINSDKTETTAFTAVRITRNTAEECYKELMGQISDGIFENCRVGKVEEI